MKRICSIEFINHPILGNLYLDFCDEQGCPVDTVILAGENGSGKSTILEAIYNLMTRCYEWYRNGEVIEANVSLQIHDTAHQLEYRFKPVLENLDLFVTDETGFSAQIYTSDFADRYPTSGVFSDVDINFTSSQISNVTSMQLDEAAESRRSDSGLASQINQLLIDVQALDDADIALAVRNNPEALAKTLAPDGRMRRFTDAFSKIFEDIHYDRIATENGHKEVIFKKGGQSISLNQLSSGEKQIVYRGGFLLKDAEALKEAFVFIDEPEISLHPSWQTRIMDYYKSVFTDQNGLQTSQLFVATHSPFIIHNDSRKDDKVIVLSRDVDGRIFVKQSPNYYKCNSIETVQDAFSTSMFLTNEPTVYVEGQTDEKYINKALEVFNLNPQFKVKWIGYLDEDGHEKNTGDTALDHGFNFYRANPQETKHAFLYDCDAKHEEETATNVLALAWPLQENTAGIKRGIENSISFNEINLNEFMTTKEIISDYGEKRAIETLNKMQLCDYICGLDAEDLKQRFSLFLPTLEKLQEFFID